MTDVSFLPTDLARWDQADGGDLFFIPVHSDVRPLRGAAGLVDWRLCGHLSRLLLQERLRGDPGERLLIPTRRLRWRAVLALGVGAAPAFSERTYADTLGDLFITMQRLGLSRVAVPLRGPGAADIAPARALALLREAAASQKHLRAVTVVDTPAAYKALGEPLPPSPAAAVKRATAGAG